MNVVDGRVVHSLVKSSQVERQFKLSRRGISSTLRICFAPLFIFVLLHLWIFTFIKAMQWINSSQPDSHPAAGCQRMVCGLDCWCDMDDSTCIWLTSDCPEIQRTWREGTEKNNTGGETKVRTKGILIGIFVGQTDIIQLKMSSTGYGLMTRRGGWAFLMLCDSIWNSLSSHAEYESVSFGYFITINVFFVI